jgi:hypothetical protein
MANNVFANMMEISCKAAAGKSIAAFPDVCFTPPLTPATPPGVPIPYPNTGLASDCTDGSSSVKISGQEVMLKNKSYFKKSSGDEAGCAPKKGVITSKIMGKVYFNMWSMDVKVEGENVVRHLDLTTHNHASQVGQTPPWPYADQLATSTTNPCKGEMERADTACENIVVKTKTTDKVVKSKTKKELCDPTDTEAADCRNRLKCRLEPQDTGASEHAIGCCPGEQAHHLIESHGFIEAGSRDNYEGTALAKFSSPQKYRPGDAPCVCAAGDRFTAEHGAFHALVGKRERKAIRKAKTKAKKEMAWNYGEAKKAGLDAHKKVFLDSQCSRGCMEAQLDAYHKKVGATNRTTLRTDDPGLQDWQTKSDPSIMNKMNADLGSSSVGSGPL